MLRCKENIHSRMHWYKVTNSYLGLWQCCSIVTAWFSCTLSTAWRSVVTIVRDREGPPMGTYSCSGLCAHRKIDWTFLRLKKVVSYHMKKTLMSLYTLLLVYLVVLFTGLITWCSALQHCVIWHQASHFIQSVPCGSRWHSACYFLLLIHAVITVLRFSQCVGMWT
jgi:hypothetical protein